MRAIIGELQEDGTQDIDVEIHPWDTWALDLTLALIIIPALEQLQDGSQSYPQEFEEFDDWADAIDKMIYAFESVVGDENSDIDYWTDERWQNTKDGFSLFGKHYTDLWM
jgi:hypothetical protein